ncbi:MAG TPA: glucoamylase family protein [Blastocatellia bacterium]|nr:glucoamylase family protein [Blastocatellia bacterium]
MQGACSPKRTQSMYKTFKPLIAVFLCLIAITEATAVGRATDLRAGLSTRDTAFVEDLSRRTFRYFEEQTNRETGLVLDRARTDGSPHDEHHRNVASIAATGFGLTAWCIAAEHKWVSTAQARERVRATLRFFADHAPHERGWFYHWMDVATGQRVWDSEVSSIDTALLLGGVLTARQYFRSDREIVRLVTAIYERVDFQWMLNGDPMLLSHGWKPESGFIRSRWDHYSEHTILSLLAVGSPTHPIPPATWYAWKRDRTNYAGYSYVDGGPLFIHQYSHAWVDYRRLREGRVPNVDYFINSVDATRAHRQFCVELSREFPGYSSNIWGITASDSIKGYVAWGGPPREPAIDGTVVPSAAAGSLMFTPDISLPALREMRRKYGGRVYGRYGFVDAFNPNTGWVDPAVIGISVGITLLSAENLRSQGVWRWFMRNVEVQRAIKLVGLVRGR